MSWTNILSAGTGAPSAGASDPDRVGHVERPEPSPGLLPGAFDLPGQLRVVAVLRGARGVRAAFPFSHVNRVVNALLGAPIAGADGATGWYRFRCRGVRAWLQLDSGPGGGRRAVDTVGAWPGHTGPGKLASIRKDRR